MGGEMAFPLYFGLPLRLRFRGLTFPLGGRFIVSSEYRLVNACQKGRCRCLRSVSFPN